MFSEGVGDLGEVVVDEAVDLVLVILVIAPEDKFTSVFDALFVGGVEVEFVKRVVPNRHGTVWLVEIFLGGDETHRMVLDHHQFLGKVHRFFETSLKVGTARERGEDFERLFAVLVLVCFLEIVVPVFMVEGDGIFPHGVGEDVRPLLQELSGLLILSEIVVNLVEISEITQHHASDDEYRDEENTGNDEWQD